MDSIESPFQFERHSNHGVVLLNPLINEGQWGTVTEVGNEILVHMETLPGQALIVDLSRLNYIGSPQVALLVRLWKSLKRSQGSMAVQCSNATIRDILSTAGLRAIWEIADTREAALAALGVTAVPPAPPSTWDWLRSGANWFFTPKPIQAQ